MALAKQKVLIPKLTAAEIAQANRAALLIWNGFSYEDGRAIISDREFLIYYSTEFLKISKKARAKFSLSQNMLHNLIVTCQLKPMFRKQSELDFPQFSNYLNRDYCRVNRAVSACSNSEEKIDYVNHLVLIAGKAAVRIGVSQAAGYRVPFASRLLFFAAPHLQIFNYASRLAEKKLNYQSRPHYAYPFYAADMLQALRSNWTHLSKYSMPTEKYGYVENEIVFAHATDWWQRRILDLALLIRFQVFKPPSNFSGIRPSLMYSHQSTATVAKP